MSTNIPGPDGAFEPDPEEWPERDAGERPAEVVVNEADDLSAALPDEDALPPEANEADVIEQRRDSGIGDEDEDEEERHLE